MLDLFEVIARQNANEPMIPVKISIPANPINVSLPTNVDLVFDGKGVGAQVANNFTITNNSKIGNIQITDVKAKIKDNGWVMNPSNQDTTYDKLPLNAKQLYMGFSKDRVSYQALREEGIDPNILIGPLGTTNSQAFYIEAKSGGTNEAINSNLVDLEFTIGYQKDGAQPIQQAAGLYDPVTGAQTKSWNQLIADGDIAVSPITAPVAMLADTDSLTPQTASVKNTYQLASGKPDTLIGELVVDDSIVQLGSGAFYECKNLTSITIPASLTRIEDASFNGCSGLISINLPITITSIGDYAFESCFNLKEIDIPKSVNSIGSGAFRDCSNLTTVRLPNSVKSITGDSTFMNCKKLESITLPDSLETIVGNMFLYCEKLKNIVIPNSVKKIDYCAFYGCKSLASIIIPISVSIIADAAFEECSNLTSVNIPDSITTIETNAFASCISLMDIVIPDSVASIGDYAFYNVPHITYHGSATGSPWDAKSMN